MSFRRLLTVGVATGVALVATACGGQGDAERGTGDAEKISVYYSVPTAEQSLASIAADNDLFPDGCEVDVQGGDSTVGYTLVTSGRAQAYINASPVPEQLASGGAPLQWAAMWQKGITTEFIARPGIDSVDDLKGKRIGIIQPKLTLSVLANAALRDAGLDPSEVKTVTLGTLPAVNSAFAAGTVDAIVTTSASAEALRAKIPGVTTLVDFSKDFPWIGSGIVVNTDWAKDNHDGVVCLLTGLNRALALVNDDPDAIKKTIGEVTSLSGKELDFAVQTVQDEFTDELQPVSEEQMTLVMKVMSEEGEEWTTKEFAGQMIGDPGYVKEATSGE